MTRDEHTHTWNRTPDDDTTWTCPDCGETTPTCRTCNRRPTGTNLLICPPCLHQEHRVLHDITHALDQWQRTPPRHPARVTRYDTNKVPTRGTNTDPTPTDIRAHQQLADDLNQWADTWALAAGSTLTLTGTIPNAINTIRDHLIWAAHNPTTSHWPTYRTHIRKARHTARLIAGLLPQRQPAPCIHCGGDVVRDWADRTWTARPDGLTDTLRCTTCGATWPDETRWRYANRHHIRVLPHVHPDALITLPEARLVFPHIPPKTLTSWALRDQLPTHGTTLRGEPLHRLADIQALDEQRTDPTRPGRPCHQNMPERTLRVASSEVSSPCPSEEPQ